MPVDALIADAEQRQALVAVRELGSAGISCCVAGVDLGAPAFSSRWCAARARLPDVALDGDAYVDALLRLCAEQRPNVLIASHDGTIEALRSRRAEVERVVALALAPERALGVAVDKRETLDLAERLGLYVPRGARVAAAEEIGPALDAVEAPLVVKPALSWAGPAAADAPGAAARAGLRLSPYLATSRADARASIEGMLAVGVPALVQEWLPGDREAISFIYGNGRVWARFAQRATRTMPPLGGFSVARESIALPADVAATAERLIEELGLEGYSEVEFRRDRRGAAALMEINPRLSASVEVAVRAGVPFNRLLYQWANGGQMEEVAGYRLGVRMRWLGADFAWLRNAMNAPDQPDVPTRSRALGAFLDDFLHPTNYDYLDRRDLRPALAAGRKAIKRTGVRVKRRRISGANGGGGLDTEVVVIGAGPYGLSVAAHLGVQGTAHETFGKTMNLWSAHMPVGMCLKSEGFASNLSDPRGECTLERFCRESEIEYGEVGVPVELDTFERYGRWFQQRAVPRVRGEQVERVTRAPRGFTVRLDSNEELRARAVVVANGMHGYAYVPPVLAELPSDRVAHTYDLRDPAQWRGETVAVVGAGQSALESATLLHEHGVNVQLVARRAKLSWNADPVLGPRSLKHRIRYPKSGLGDARDLRLYSNHPLIMHALREDRRTEIAFTALGPAGAWWLRPRFEGKIEARLGRTIEQAEASDDGVRLDLRGPGGGEELRADRVLAGTGYRPELERVAFLDRALRAEIQRCAGAPALTRSFESSAPGVFFVGYAAAVSFGPVMRFVFGTEFTARRVARRLD